MLIYSRDINTVDVMYPSFPMFLYMNPTLAMGLLEPVLRYMESGQFSQKYVPHDLGKLVKNPRRSRPNPR